MHEPLAPSHQAFFDFREDTKGLETLPPEAQIAVLKHKLFVALERALDFQQRSRSLERLLEQLHSDERARAREHQAFAARASRELCEAQRRCEFLLETIEFAAILDASAKAPAPVASGTG
jgi:hypothetical protein